MNRNVVPALLLTGVFSHYVVLELLHLPQHRDYVAGRAGR